MNGFATHTHIWCSVIVDYVNYWFGIALMSFILETTLHIHKMNKTLKESPLSKRKKISTNAFTFLRRWLFKSEQNLFSVEYLNIYSKFDDIFENFFFYCCFKGVKIHRDWKYIIVLEHFFVFLLFCSPLISREWQNNNMQWFRLKLIE